MGQNLTINKLADLIEDGAYQTAIALITDYHGADIVIKTLQLAHELNARGKSALTADLLEQLLASGTTTVKSVAMGEVSYAGYLFSVNERYVNPN